MRTMCSLAMGPRGSRPYLEPARAVLLGVRQAELAYGHALMPDAGRPAGGRTISTAYRTAEGPGF